MQKNNTSNSSYRKRPDEVATIIAGIYNVTPRYVRMVRDGECADEKILAAYIDYVQNKNEWIEAQKSFIEQINQLVPFN